MKLDELEKCLHIIGYWLNEDKTVIDKLLNENTNIVKEYLEPFTKELNSNLLYKESFEAKRDLIKFYIFEFYELQGFIETHKEVLLIGSLNNYSNNKYEHESETGFVRKLNEIENYFVKSHELFDMIFNEIQLCCIKYKIDFYELCNELNFSTEYFDTGVTMAFDEMQSDSVKPKQVEPKGEKLKVPQIALIHVYEDMQITRGNAAKIASEYGYVAKNSGEGLFQDYTKYCNTANRKDIPTPCTPKKLKNKINFFESVIVYLSEPAKLKAIDEIKILKMKFDNEYK